jgi:hypothetical protein
LTGLSQPIEIEADRPLWVGIDPASGDPAVWAEVPTDRAPAGARLRVFGTGHEFADNDMLYVGSIVGHSGVFVWHIYWDQSSEPSP